MRFLFALLLSLPSALMAADYHLAADGDDTRDGLSPASAWRSLARVPAANLEPGDQVLFRGGDTFSGGLILTRGGAPGRPVTLASYGVGLARIVAPAGQDALRIEDCGHLVITRLELVGPGLAHPDASGLRLLARSRFSENIVISQIIARAFPGSGIQLHSESPGAGFADLLIERVSGSGNGIAGLSSWGPVTGDAYSFHRVTVRDSWFFSNPGLTGKTDNHSGNGLILGDCDLALVERCAAWDNGADCAYPGGGPVGLWLCESRRSVIRDSVSYRNRTGSSSLDGGGFDLDGGTVGCVIERCLSFGNDGAGYLFCQYVRARPMRDNIVRDSISLHDGRAHDYGALTVWSPRPEEFSGLLATHNLLLTAPPAPERATATPAVLRLRSAITDAHFHNTLALAFPGGVFIDALDPAPAHGGWSFAANTWLSLDGSARLRGADGRALAWEDLPAARGLPADLVAPRSWGPALPGPADLPTDHSPGALAPLLDALRVWAENVPGEIAPLAPRWAEVLRAAGCDPSLPSGRGPRVLAAYGPAPSP